MLTLLKPASKSSASIHSMRRERVWEHPAIKDMARAPYNFNKHLDCYFLSSPNMYCGNSTSLMLSL